MKKIFVLPFFIFLLSQYSCIDRDTIAGTGKEEPDRMVGTGGDLQSGVVSSMLSTPLSVRILSDKGRPVRNVTVEFLTPLSNVSLSDTLVVTDGDGNASTKATLGSKADSIKVHATVIGIKGSPVIFSLLARSATEAKAEILTGNNQTGPVKSTLGPLKVKVYDEFNNTVKNVAVFFTTPNGTITPTAYTDSTGVASGFWTLDSLAGIKTATAQVPSIANGLFNFSATGRALTTPATFTLLTEDTLLALQATTVYNAISVRTRDVYGNNIPLVPVQFNVVQGSSAISPTSSQTGLDGTAAATLLLNLVDSVGVQDTIVIIKASIDFGFPPFTIRTIVYKYLQIDSLRSSGGNVELFWQKNLNQNLANFTLERCNNFNFDNSTVIVAVITDANSTTIVDSTATIGTSPFYRIKVNYSTGFSFYTNIRQVTVSP